MKTAVIVTTYNRPDALARVLEGFLAQGTLDFSLLVADDGSTGETRRVVEGYAARATFAVEHVWQEDRGFRAAAIRNRAVAATDADYVVFTDGDCIPSRGFVAAHRRLAERGWFLAGNRMLLARDFTARVLAERLPVHTWTNAQWLGAWLKRDINRLAPLAALGDGAFRKLRPARWKGVKTCNLSVWREDLERVNGLDESYSGWGLEDSDLVIRLQHAGVKHKSARFAAPLFHLWHAENDRTRLAENERRLAALLHSDRVTALRGLDLHRDVEPGSAGA
jgi:glycosyltransferase involved in cell wall biosynthesis